MLRPLLNRVIVLPNEPADRTPSGILLPEASREQPRQGRVLAVGPGRHSPAGELLPMSVSVGDQVLFGKHAGNVVEDTDGTEMLVMTVDEIMAVLG